MKLFTNSVNQLAINKSMQVMSGILCLLFASSVMALQSIKLNDVIKANGSGNIDLFTPFDSKHTLDAAVLEQFRQDNDGELVFAIDINEAANGSEKASTQGVAIESAELILIIDGTEYRYNQFTTRTNSMLAIKGSTQRGLYSTLLGDSGSNRITPNSDSDIFGSSFDSTLNFPLAQDISQASAATLIIQFLDTNVSLGDPEAFYDFSNGYEDIAIITFDDANYLNQLAPGMEGAPLVLPEDTVASTDGGTVYYPSQTGYYIAAYEDLFPYRGDYDFNDLVVGYRVAAGFNSDGNIRTLSGEGYLIARGAGYNHDWHLRIAMPASSSGSGEIKLFMPGEVNTSDGYPLALNVVGDIDLTPFQNTRWLWVDTPYEGVNTLDEQSLLKGHRFSFNITLDTPIALTSLDSAPFDPYLYVHDTGFEIHLTGKNSTLPYSRNVEEGQTSFTDSNNYPFAQIFPETWQVPIERTDLGDAYPDFINFILSGRNQNIQWYNTPNNARVKPITPSHWKW
jgi:LruC domain-containing protein